MNRDALGWRCKFGALVPSTNTIVQPEYDGFRPAGVTNHVARIFTPNAQVASSDANLAGIARIGEGVVDAIHSVMTCEPNHLVIGISALSFLGGAAGADQFQKMLEKESGISVSIGSHACAAALEAYGCGKRLAFISPYWSAGNDEVTSYFSDMGFQVMRHSSLRSRSWLEIAEVPETECRALLETLNGDDVDAIIQAGTNLAFARLAGEAERWLGKPVIAMNTATYWHALRSNGISDPVRGFGRLLEEL
jgi:maleate isomerase